MAAKISYKDDTLTIVADEGSTVRNVRVAGKRVSIEREVSWWTVLARLCFYLLCLALCLGCWAYLLSACSSIAGASPANCELIKDADQRHYCRACSRPQLSECEFIKDADLRQQCRALCRRASK